jgi:hypothetical protein
MKKETLFKKVDGEWKEIEMNIYDDPEIMNSERTASVEVKPDQVKVNTANFRLVHGRSPSGMVSLSGDRLIGHWMFFRFLNQKELVVAEGLGTYTEIKVKAIAKAKELGITEIHAGI